MVRWHEPEGSALDEAVDQVLADLNLEDDPSVEEVIGMTSPELLNHAIRAIAVLTNGGQIQMGDPNGLIQLYCLGFVVGVRFEKRKHQ